MCTVLSLWGKCFLNLFVNTLIEMIQRISFQTLFFSIYVSRFSKELSIVVYLISITDINRLLVRHLRSYTTLSRLCAGILSTSLYIYSAGHA